MYILNGRLKVLEVLGITSSLSLRRVPVEQTVEGELVLEITPQVQTHPAIADLKLLKYSLTIDKLDLLAGCS